MYRYLLTEMLFIERAWKYIVYNKTVNTVEFSWFSQIERISQICYIFDQLVKVSFSHYLTFIICLFLAQLTQSVMWFIVVILTSIVYHFDYFIWITGPVGTKLYKNDICEVVYKNYSFLLDLANCNGSVMVSVLTSSVVDREFTPWSDQTKDYKIGIGCFSTKHATSRRKSKVWLAQNQDNVFVWGNIYLRTVVSVC